MEEPTPKPSTMPFLGGYKDTKSGKEFYHAQTQTRDLAREQRLERQREKLKGILRIVLDGARL